VGGEDGSWIYPGVFLDVVFFFEIVYGFLLQFMI
jgi:hypothetical protein